MTKISWISLVQCVAIVRWEEPSKTWNFLWLLLNDKKSSPKRFLFYYENEKSKTVKKNILEPLVNKDFEDLVDRFDVEVVRKEFFALYMDLFLELYGEIKDNDTFKSINRTVKNWTCIFCRRILCERWYSYILSKKNDGFE